MADGMHVDPEALLARSPKFAAAADRLKKAFEDLEAVKTVEGPCWGSDEPGKNFEGEYTGAVDAADKGLEFLTDSLTVTTEELNKTAERWESDDHNAAVNIDAAGSAT